MFKQFIDDLIDSSSIKVIMTAEAKDNFAEEEGVLFVHSPILFRLYTLYAEGAVKEDRPAFYRKAGAYLYYEHFYCTHGEEYYYFIKFNKDSLFYQEHEDLIKQLVIANDPTTLLTYIGTKPLDIYNKSLKEELK